MNSLPFLTVAVFLLGCLASAIHASSCSVGVDAQPRPGAWVVGSVTNQIYDLSIFNNGSCDTTDIIFLSLTLHDPSDAVTQFWNLFQEDATHFAFLGTDYASSSVSAGFVLSYTTPSEGLVTVNLLSADCAPTAGHCVGGSTFGQQPTCSDLVCTFDPKVCISDGGLPRCVANVPPPSVSTSSSSSSSSVSSTSSSSSTTSSSSSSTTGSPHCQISAVVSARAGGSWVAGGTQFQIYDVAVTNVGSCVISAVRLEVLFAAGSSVQSAWNLDAEFNLENFGSMLPGASFSGAGFVLQGGGAIFLAPAPISCTC